jgi:Coenzyme PQQ synthesis protein D (PqqD)
LQKEDTNLDAALSPASIVIASKEQVSCSLGDESAILNMKNSVYYGLNPVGARIWSLLREPRSVQELCEAIVHEYDVEGEQCERDVLDLLEKMKSEGLVELSGKK